jgi:hypothetical protein
MAESAEGALHATGKTTADIDWVIRTRPTSGSWTRR